MKEFKNGDRVEIDVSALSSSFDFTFHNFSLATVVRCDRDDYVKIDMDGVPDQELIAVLHEVGAYWDMSSERAKYWYIKSSLLKKAENMKTEFKIGDKVKINKEMLGISWDEIELTAKVTEISKDRPVIWFTGGSLINFSKTIDALGSHGLIPDNTKGRIVPNDNYLILMGDIKEEKPSFKVGDRVAIRSKLLGISCKEEIFGKVIEIDKINRIKIEITNTNYLGETLNGLKRAGCVCDSGWWIPSGKYLRLYTNNLDEIIQHPLTPEECLNPLLLLI